MAKEPLADMVTTEQAAELLGVSSRRVRALITSGRLPAIQVTPRLKLIKRADLDKVKDRKPGRPRKDEEQ